MINIRKSQERGHANHGWLDSYHSFSFAHYYDPEFMGFSVLRVINEDVVAPARGFGMHPHRDMEIITYMLGGAIQHKDSLGNGSIIRAGDVQRMTAGTGIVHSEFNASDAEPAHLLQIWLLPDTGNLTPGYEEKHFEQQEKTNRWSLIASPDSRDGSLKIHQDVNLLATYLEQGKRLVYEAQANRSFYLQVAQGSLLVNGQTLLAGDAVVIDADTRVEIEAVANVEALLFDLPLHAAGSPH
ncbi:MAG: pirin family protein [Candidatus Methylopumilus sp.]|jgi:hypothetical protein